MPRRGNVPKREVLPDPLYNSVLVTKLVNSIMLDGKKGVSQKVVYGAFDIIKEKTEVNAFIALRQNPALVRWHDDIISTKAWTGTGWNAWNRYGSVEERVTEYIEKKEAERREFIEQRRREDEALLEKALERFKCVK